MPQTNKIKLPKLQGQLYHVLFFCFQDLLDLFKKAMIVVYLGKTDAKKMY